MKIDEKPEKLKMTLELESGMTYESDKVIIQEIKLDDNRHAYTVPPDYIFVHHPFLVLSQVDVRMTVVFRLLVGEDGNMLRMFRRITWLDRLTWKIGYMMGYIQGILGAQPEEADPLAWFDELERQ